MRVTLLTHTHQPERIVAAAAKLCYSPATVDELLVGLTEEKTASFVEMLSQIGHESPIEHASFTFAVEGVTRTLLAQLTRHRMASYSVQSQRYVEEGAFDYVIPPEIEAVPEAREAFVQAMDQAGESYRLLAGILKEKHKKVLVENGLDEKAAKSKAAKMAIEDARFVLPGACDTKLVVSMNARSLLNFFRIRCCNRAQWEIRALADEMLRLVVGAAPTLFSAAGPSCLGGPCPEGKMSCGKMAQVRERYKALKAAEG